MWHLSGCHAFPLEGLGEEYYDIIISGMSVTPVQALQVKFNAGSLSPAWP
jgi:hypothetical protein